MIHENPFNYLERHADEIQAMLDAELAELDQRKRRRQGLAAVALVCIGVMVTRGWLGGRSGEAASPGGSAAPRAAESEPARLWLTDSAEKKRFGELMGLMSTIDADLRDDAWCRDVRAVLADLPFEELDLTVPTNVAHMRQILGAIGYAHANEYRPVVERLLDHPDGRLRLAARRCANLLGTPAPIGGLEQ